jgi:hypothetical protein
MISIVGLWAGEYASGGANPFQVRHLTDIIISIIIIFLFFFPIPSSRRAAKAKRP